MEVKNKSNILIIIFILLFGIILIIGAFFVGNIIGKNSISNNKKVIEKDNNNIDSPENLKMINTYSSKFFIPDNIITSLKSGSTNNFNDFTKIYIAINNIIYNNESNIKCNISDICIKSDLVNLKIKDIFLSNTEVIHSNYAQFKNYLVSGKNIIYDSTNNLYIIKDYYNINNDFIDGYIKIPYKITEEKNKYLLSYYLIYKAKETINNEEKYSYYLNSNKKDLIFRLEENELNKETSRLLNSYIKVNFRTITLSLSNNYGKIYFSEFK